MDMILNPYQKPENAGALVLDDPNGPIVFEGYLWGSLPSAAKIKSANKDFAYGEVCFNTSLTGYQEILTDPSYYGQMICMTTPQIGNTGVNLDDPESAHPWCAGFIVHELSISPSSWRSSQSLDEYLKKHDIPGICGVDTRALTRILRSKGVVRGVILPLSEVKLASELLKSLPPFEGRDLIKEVTTKEPYLWPHPLSKNSSHEFLNLHQNKTSQRYKVIAVDFGAKWNLFRSLEALGCDLTVVPATTSASKILEYKPQGIFLSNGPGDPAMATYAHEMVRGILGKVPLFGVCMGHQILGIALGAKTYKLKFGHRGGNQPVLDRTTRQVEISSQNHGYAIDESTLPKEAQVTHINLNDETVEGISVPKYKAFSVQYHPESCPGPHDSRVLFERFIDLMRSSS